MCLILVLVGGLEMFDLLCRPLYVFESRRSTPNKMKFKCVNVQTRSNTHTDIRTNIVYTLAWTYWLASNVHFWRFLSDSDSNVSRFKKTTTLSQHGVCYKIESCMLEWVRVCLAWSFRTKRFMQTNLFETAWSFVKC